MAITSVGYDGTVDEVQWASMVSKVGSYEYGVDGAGHFAVNQIAGTRMISVALGVAWGRGVMDTSDSTVNIQLDSVATGSRWDMIALRRTWGPANGGPTEIVVVKGTSTKALPSSRQKNPGVIDDQPLALVRVQAGQSSIPEIVDLRVWGRNGGQLFAKDDLVRSYVASVGTEININGTLWQRTVSANSIAEWVKVGPRSDTQWVHRANLAAKSGWKVNYLRYRVKDGLVQVLMVFERTGAEIEVTADGNIPSQPIVTAPSAIVPRIWWAPLVSGPGGRVAVGSLSSDTGVIALDAVTQTKIRRGEGFTLTGTYFLD